MRRMRKVKILATVGPACSSKEMIRKLFDAGVDVFRLNMSHGTHADMAKRHAVIREVEREVGRPIGILADLQGPKLRVGTMDPVELVAGQAFRMDLDPAKGDQTRANLPHKEIFQALEVGSTLLLNDGKIRLKVTKAAKDHAETEVIIGGPLSSNKGVNVPDVILPLAALSEKDRKDLDFALRQGVDWVALSFVQRPEDVLEAKAIIKGQAMVMSKIEKPRALDRIDEIIEASDGIMVARGDLGVEMPIEVVPGIQKNLIRASRQAGRPVVVATQMLESMIEAPLPTRAEVSDVATAVFEGADAVMLSAESAVGKFPTEAVAMMDAIARSAETDPQYRGIIERAITPPDPTSADAITNAAKMVAGTIHASAIVCYTSSGSTGLRASRERPDAPILVLSPKLETARRMAMAWGCHCVVTEDAENFRTMVQRAMEVTINEGFGKAGERIVITAGVPFGTPGRTNILRIAMLGTERG